MTPRLLTLAVDVDETVADLLGPWLARYNRESGDTLLPEMLDGWDMGKQVREGWADRLYEFLTPDLYDTVLPIPGARTAVEVLRLMGHRVVFVTSCVRNTADAKLNWLIRWGFLENRRFQPDFVTASDKRLIRADALADDRTEAVDSFPGMGFLVAQPHNARYAGRRPRTTIWELPAAVQAWLDSPYAD